MGGPDDTGTIDFLSDDERHTGEEVDAATYVAAAVFNAVALPAGMPDYLKPLSTAVPTRRVTLPPKRASSSRPKAR